MSSLRQPGARGRTENLTVSYLAVVKPPPGSPPVLQRETLLEEQDAVQPRGDVPANVAAKLAALLRGPTRLTPAPRRREQVLVRVGWRHQCLVNSRTLKRPGEPIERPAKGPRLEASAAEEQRPALVVLPRSRLKRRRWQTRPERRPVGVSEESAKLGRRSPRKRKIRCSFMEAFFVLGGPGSLRVNTWSAAHSHRTGDAEPPQPT